MDYILSKHLANSGGNLDKKAGRAGLPGRSSRVIMTNEARVLRELRLQTGLSMRKAGDLLGYSDSYVSHIENGRVDVPTGENLDKFLKVYGDIKQKSFYERVRRYSEAINPRQELLDLVASISTDKIKVATQILKSI